MAAPITYIGYTPGLGTGETHNTPDLTGWQTAYHNIGPGSTATVNGSPFAQVTKVFDPPNGYPNFPTAWGGNAQTFANNNGGLPLLPVIAFGSGPGPSTQPPAQSTILAFLQSLPAGQKCGFCFISEMESGTDGLSPAQFVTNWETISQRLTAALGQMATATNNPSFWRRANFPMVTSSLMSHYAGGGDTLWLPPPAHVDIYGSDFYQNVGPGTTQNVGAQSDNRFQNWLKNVKIVAGPNPVLGCPEYGIRTVSFSTLTSAQQQTTEAQRAALLAKDIAYFTGSSRPGGTSAFALLNYWYQMPGAGNNGCFPLCDGSETKAQAIATINTWQSAITGGPQPQNTISVTVPGTQSNTVGNTVSLLVTAIDSDPSQTLTFKASGTLPPGVAISQTGGQITGTLTAAGTYSVVITVTDPTGATGTGSFSWVVSQSQVPVVTVINPGPQTATKGVSITPLTIQATDSAGLPLTYSASNLPAGLSIAPASGQITGTPTTASAPLVTVTVTDSSSASSQVQFTWTVVASVVTVNSPGSQSNTTNDVVSLQITGTDSAGLPVAYSATGLPTGLAISAAGKITGTATAAGTFSTVVTGTDTQGSAGQAAFTWVVSNVSVSVTSPGDQINNLGDTVSLQVNANDSASLTVTFSASNLPPGLAIASGTGLITGQPTTSGVYQVILTATDSSSNQGSATFAWTINTAAPILVVSIAPASGQDIYGNSYPAGLTVGLPGGPQTTIGLDGTLRYAAPVTEMPAMVNGWATTGHAKWAIDVLGNLVVSFKLLIPGPTPVDGTLIWPQNSLPPTARPGTKRRVACYCDDLRQPSGTFSEAAALEFLPDGSVACYGVANAATRVDLFAVIPLTF